MENEPLKYMISIIAIILIAGAIAFSYIFFHPDAIYTFIAWIKYMIGLLGNAIIACFVVAIIFFLYETRKKNNNK